MRYLVVGLGGTGTEIVRRARDRWESEGGIPENVALAVIDARNREPQGGPIPDVSFTPNNALDYDARFAESRPDLDDWWPEAVRPQAVHFGDGCGAVRANGRFFAFWFADRIVETIRAATQTLVAKRPDLGGAGPEPFHVFLCGSLGNGTCGGIFHEVAAIARSELRGLASSMRVFGIFVPGSVTRWNHSGVEACRVAGNGYASLVELQHEFDRRKAGAGTYEPYAFVAHGDVGLSTFLAGTEGDAGASPIDFAFVLDGRDRNARTSEYRDLLNVAAEGLVMMAGRTDDGARLLDPLVNAQGGRRFCSFGAARLTVPAGRLFDWTVAEHTLSTLREAASPNPGTWARLLADTAPDGKRLGPDGVTVEESVGFFVEHVLEVREAGAQGGEQCDQLFDRFEERDRAIEVEFNRRAAGVDDLKRPADIVAKADEITTFVTDSVARLAADRLAEFVGTQDSLWARLPADPKEPSDAGVRWQVDRRIEEFVAAGAFGLASTWVREFHRQIGLNRESVEKHERAKFLADPSHGDIDLPATMAGLRDMADGVFAGLRRRRLLDEAGRILLAARSKFDFLLWEAKIEAVEAFYATMESHLEILERATLTAAGRLRDPSMTSRLEADSRAITRELDANLRRERTPEGLQAEFFVGGAGSMREALRAEIRASVDASSQAVLSALTAENLRFFRSALGTDAEVFGPAGPDPEPPAPATGSQAIATFREALRALVAARVDPIVASRCTVDRMLDEEARALVREYERTHVRDRDGIDRRQQDETRRRIVAEAGQIVFDRLRSLPFESDSEKALRDGAALVVAGRLSGLAGYATAQWSIVATREQAGGISRHCFVSYHDSVESIPKAIELIPKLGLPAGMPEVTPGPSPRHDTRSVDVLAVELGADLSMLDMAGEVPAYLRAMTHEESFCPHSTRHYREIGMAWLRDGCGQRSRGEPLLALAEEWGIVRRDKKKGCYLLAADLPADQASGRTSAFLAGHPVGDASVRGPEAPARFLDGSDGEGPQLLQSLGAAVLAAMETDAYGDDGRKRIGWTGVAERITTTGAALRQKATKAHDSSQHGFLERQARALDDVAADLVEANGRRPIWLFR